MKLYVWTLLTCHIARCQNVLDLLYHLLKLFLRRMLAQGLHYCCQLLKINQCFILATVIIVTCLILWPCVVSCIKFFKEFVKSKKVSELWICYKILSNFCRFVSKQWLQDSPPGLNIFTPRLTFFSVFPRIARYRDDSTNVFGLKQNLAPQILCDPKESWVDQRPDLSRAVEDCLGGGQFGWLFICGGHWKESFSILDFENRKLTSLEMLYPNPKQ